MQNVQPPLQLEDIFFPLQEVRALAEHDPQGELRGTHIIQSIEFQVLDAAAGRYGVVLDMTIDEEKSHNPPYCFRLQAFASFFISPEIDPISAQALVQTNGVMILIGAMRERLLELTSRAPWGRFLLNTQPIQLLHQGELSTKE
jgi:hypothetical protein